MTGDWANIDEEHVPNFQLVSTELYRGGQPSRTGFLHLKKIGVRTIVNLRDEHFDVKNEGELVSSLGLRYLSIPLSPFEKPSTAEISQFLDALEHAPHQPHYVHCLHGMDRTGTMLSLHRMHSCGWSLEEAYDEMIKFGFHPHFDNLTKAVHEFARHHGR